MTLGGYIQLMKTFGKSFLLSLLILFAGLFLALRISTETKYYLGMALGTYTTIIALLRYFDKPFRTYCKIFLLGVVVFVCVELIITVPYSLSNMLSFSVGIVKFICLNFLISTVMIMVIKKV